MTVNRSTYRRLSGSGLRFTPFFLIALFALVAVLLVTPNVFAVPGKLKQQILPLDCVFEIVNDGTGTVIYHTPEECGQIPEPEPEPEPEPVDPTNPPIDRPGTVTIIDTGGGSPIVQVPVVPTPGTKPTPLVPDITVTQISPNSNEITVSWRVPTGMKFREFIIEVRRVGVVPWTQVATVADNRRSTIISLTEGEFDVRVTGIPTDPNAAPVVLGVTRVIVQYTPLPAEEKTDYSWIPWVLLALVIIASFWWNRASRRKKRS